MLIDLYNQMGEMQTFQFLTEIPKLQEFLQELNDCHSETLNYVSGAYGILSLIQGARRREVVRSSNKRLFIVITTENNYIAIK